METHRTPPPLERPKRDIRAKYKAAKRLYEVGAKGGAMSVLDNIFFECLRSSSLWMRCKAWFIDELYFRRAKRLRRKIYRETQKSPHHQAFRMYLDGDYQAALALCNEILEVEPHNASALSTRGVVYEALGYEELSRKDIELSQRLNPPPINRLSP